MSWFLIPKELLLDEPDFCGFPTVRLMNDLTITLIIGPAVPPAGRQI